jgi:hypothetical protein
VRNLFGVESRSNLIAAAFFALASLWIAGCSSSSEPSQPAFTVKPAGSQTNLVIAPAKSAVGRVTKVNLAAKFVVLSFPVAQVPANDTRMAIFRAGAKVGEVKISGPAQGTFTVGDITGGSAQEGDEVWAE